LLVIKSTSNVQATSVCTVASISMKKTFHEMVLRVD